MRACDNPFRSERVLQVRYQLQGATWEDLLARWQERQRRGAIIGPHGTGKTTLLESVEPRLREQGLDTRFLRLNTEQRELAPGLLNQICASLTPSVVLLLDGAEQMSALAWRWFLWRTRRAGGLLITTHQAGRLPTVWECRTSATLLAEIAARLLAVEPAAVQERAEELFQKHRGNLRDALREWYDLVAG
jgi:hypothetical protein